MLEVKIVEYIVIGSIGFLILFNFYLNFNKVENDTINVILKNWAYSKYFFITFVWGVLGGHFFLGTEIPVIGCNWWLPPVLLVLIVAFLIWIGRHLDRSFVLLRSYQLFLLLSGILYGHFIWSQRHLPEICFPWSQ